MRRHRTLLTADRTVVGFSRQLDLDENSSMLRRAIG